MRMEEVLSFLKDLDSFEDLPDDIKKDWKTFFQGKMLPNA
jgi:hypothetical protein